MSSYTDFEILLQNAEQTWMVDFTALNSSGVSGTAVLALDEDNGANGTLSVAIAATGLTPDQAHPQHIHGTFDADGTPTDAISPTLMADADRDGVVEVLEGVPFYGDVILSLVEGADRATVTADASGLVSFTQSYDLSDAANLLSPVTGTQYDAEDLIDLDLREIVLHGVQVPDGIGEGTEGEVDGGENGYVPILPAAAGEIMSIDVDRAAELLSDQRTLSSTRSIFGEGDDDFDGGAGDDFAAGQAGNDMLRGGGDNDTLRGGIGDDTLIGNDGRDVLDGNGGDDLVDAGTDDTNRASPSDDGASGALTLSDYDNGLAGGAGNDVVRGRAGDDIITGDDDSRVSEAAGTVFDVSADGSDTIFGGAGNDEIHSGTWSDGDQGLMNMSTGAMDDTVYGGSGNDILRGAGGSDLLQGDRGADNIGGGGGDDTLRGDGFDVVNPTEVTGQIFRLYDAAFGRVPDLDGFQFWAEALATGSADIEEIADGFVTSPEFIMTYGDLSNEGFVNALYRNVLDRDADDEGAMGWIDRLEAGESRASVLTGFSQSMESRTLNESATAQWVADQGTNDVLFGNGGANVLAGGVLSDQFVFSTDDGSSHTVTDFEDWDMLDFSAFGYDDASAARANMQQSGDDVVFTDMGVTVIVQATTLATLDDDAILV